MKVWIPQPLRSYTRESHVEAEGPTLRDLLADLERRHPGIRFRMVDEQDRIRRHVRIFVNRAQVFDLDTALTADDEVHIFQALSGG